jgi:hypothetical protein
MDVLEQRRGDETAELTDAPVMIRRIPSSRRRSPGRTPHPFGIKEFIRDGLGVCRGPRP